MPVYTTLYVIFNGPPGCGKTTMANALTNMLRASHPTCDPYSVTQESFANPMKHFIATTLGMKYAELRKDTPAAVLSGYSPREFLIDLSERYIKPRYGEDFYGRALVHRVLRAEPLPAVVVIDDSGFQEEVDPVENRVLIRVYREGCNYDNDSRKYLSDPNIIIHNNGTMSDLRVELSNVREFILGHKRFSWK